MKYSQSLKLVLFLVFSLRINKHSPSDGVPLTGSTLYRTIVGILVYLIVTHPDIAHVVHVVSQFVSAPKTVHWGVILHILKYLWDTQF